MILTSDFFLLNFLYNLFINLFFNVEDYIFYERIHLNYDKFF